MIIRYKFATGETLEIETTKEWVTVIEELDREEYNIDRKETRRHCSLEAYNLDDALLPSDSDVLAEVLDNEERQQVETAISKLNPRQQMLIRQVFFEGHGYTSIARNEDLDESAVRHAVERALKKLKKFCDRPSESGSAVAYL